MFWSKKRRIKGEKYITPREFPEHLRKLDVSENIAKFIMLDS